MSFWNFIAFNLMVLFWLGVGALIFGWAYFRGLNRQDPIPKLTIPKAGIFSRPKPESNGEDDAIPASMRPRV